MSNDPHAEPSRDDLIAEDLDQIHRIAFAAFKAEQAGRDIDGGIEFDDGRLTISLPVACSAHCETAADVIAEATAQLESLIEHFHHAVVAVDRQLAICGR